MIKYLKKINSTALIHIVTRQNSGSISVAEADEYKQHAKEAAEFARGTIEDYLPHLNSMPL